MTTEQLLESPIIPILVSLGILYITVRVVAFHDMSLLTKDQNRKYKDKEAYLKEAGKLLIALTVVSFLTTALTFVNETVSLLLFLAGFGVFVFFWKKMDQKYGG